MDALVDETVSPPGGSVGGAGEERSGAEGGTAAGEAGMGGAGASDQERGLESARESRRGGGSSQGGTGVSTSARVVRL
jgi:hypothetical protein